MAVLSIVVPTYREHDNLPILIERVFTATAAAGIDAEMIIVDDDSRDGSEAVVATCAQTHPVRIITRTNERGLSSAVLRGFEDAQGEFLLVMDADLSHPPERVADLLAAVQRDGADFALGSRYVRGGTTVDWSVLRWINSKVATWLARPLTSVNDPMSGFFCLRRDRWKQAATLNPLGYKIGLELIVKCRCKRVVEVPIQFSDRLHGKSKLTARQQLDYLRHLARLYRYRLLRR